MEKKEEKESDKKVREYKFNALFFGWFAAIQFILIFVYHLNHRISPGTGFTSLATFILLLQLMFYFKILEHIYKEK
jgi:hypothetical protein